MNIQNSLISKILLEGSPAEKKELFSFSLEDSNEKILLKFKLFASSQYPRFFTSPLCDEHEETMENYLDSYRGVSCLEVGFRGYAKTTIKKLFDVFVILNDVDNTRKYIKVLCKDLSNSRQITTDVYNLIVEVKYIYGDIFEQKGDIKREETMSSFTTKDGVKYTAGTVGQTQRGNVQDAYRPDWIWFDDIEDGESVTSLIQTMSIIKRADEAIQGLSINGSYVVTANYISDAGVVQSFIDKKIRTHIVSIIKPDGTPTWSRFTMEKIEQLKKDAFDWAGDYLSDPTRSGSKFFDVERVENDIKNAVEPEMSVAGVSIWKDYKPNNYYGIGVDLSDGIGKDSCAFTVFDYRTGEIVASYDDNETPPDMFTYQAIKIGQMYSNCIIAPEINNTCGGIAISTLKDANYPNIYRKRIEDKVGNTLTTQLGWSTNAKTKVTMFHDFARDYQDGLIKIYDARLLKEMKAFTKNDLKNQTTGAITRHFDLLTSACIAWQMKDEANSGVSTKSFYENLKKTGSSSQARS